MDSYPLEKLNRFLRYGVAEDINEAVRSARQILESVPDNHPSRNGLMNNFSIILETRYEHFRALRDLQEAVEMSKNIVEATPVAHPNYQIYKLSYSNKLLTLFQSSRNISYLNMAIEIAQEVIDNIPSTDPFAVSVLQSLSVKLAVRYETQGSRQDLYDAIKMAEEVLERTPDERPERAEMTHNLANMYENLFNIEGGAEQESRAIDSAEAAMLETPEDHVRRPVHLTMLGHNLWRRFERTGRIEDLERAIDCLAEVTDPSRPPDRQLPSRLNSLAALLFTRYERSGDQQDSRGDLGKAILAVEDALELFPRYGGDLSMYQANLGALLVNRYLLWGDGEDLDRAIKLGQESLQTTDASHYNNLAMALKTHHIKTGRREDLTEAIRYAQLAVDNTAPDHRDLSGRLNNLGYLVSLDSSDRSEYALHCFERSWRNVRGTPFHRVDAARQALRLLAARGRWQDAMAISKEGVQLLSLMNNRSLSREDQEVVASKFAGLVSDACSISLEAGDSASNALGLLEHGRGSIMGMLVDDRSDLTQLERDHPQQARKYRELREEVNRSSQRNLATETKDRRVGQHIDLVGSLAKCINEIRQLPGYDQFLLPQSSEQLMKLAAGGPLVIVNVTDFRSDAFIVSESSIKSIGLSNMTAAWVRNSKVVHDTSLDLLTRTRRHKECLMELWSRCVETVLQNVSIRKGPNGKPLTRIWWVGTGEATSLPFHAAGDHSRRSTKNTASQVISSYTPTLKALGYARERAKVAAVTNPSEKLLELLAVAMPETPEMSSLETANEMKIVLDVTRTMASGVGLTQPDAATVLSHLQRCEIAHFACHGVSETTSPLASYLALHNNDWASPRVDKLTVGQICEAHLENVWIAYLSACSTAENRVQKLNDEAIHLASGFQVAGFSHVVASLWSADDETCVEVAHGFYERLALGANSRHSNDDVAIALHDSINAVRTKPRSTPLKWGAFIHIGA